VTTGIDELVVPYDPTPAANRVQRWQRMLRSRLISLGISVLILILVFIWQRDRLTANPTGTIVVYGVILLAGLGWALFCWIALRRSRAAVAASGRGTALRVSRAGVEVAGRQFGWSQLAAPARRGLPEAVQQPLLLLGPGDGAVLREALLDVLPPAVAGQLVVSVLAGVHHVEVGELAPLDGAVDLHVRPRRHGR